MGELWCGSAGGLASGSGLGESVGVGAGFGDGAAEGEAVDDRGAKARVGEGLGPAIRGWHMFVFGGRPWCWPDALLLVFGTLEAWASYVRWHLNPSGVRKVCRGVVAVPGGGGRAVPVGPLATDPWEYQAECVEAFVASWRARGFSRVTIENDIGLLDRTLRALGRPAWEVTPEDIDRVVGDLAVLGRASSTRREYVQIFKMFHRFLQIRKAVEIEAAFGVRLVCPIDEFNASRHVGDDSPAELPPPTPERVEEFFDFLKTRIATARKYAPAARDYALFRTLYHAGLRSEESALLDQPDVHFNRGPFGKLHVRFGKGARTSGPRPRWVPMLDGLDLVLHWFLDDVRGKFPASPMLFADESGGSLHPGTIRNRLRYLMQLEARPPAEWFSPHALRRACATHNYERGVDLVAIQQFLGHWTVSSTMRYVRPSATFIEDAYRRAVTSTLSELTEEGPA